MQKEIVEQVQRFTSLGEFAAGVAHDMRALLSPIDQHAMQLDSQPGGDTTVRIDLPAVTQQ